MLSSAVLAHILASDPTTKVTVVTSTLAADLFLGVPRLERIVTMQKMSYNRHWLRFWLETVGTAWDAIWDMRGSIAPQFLRRGKLHSFYKVREPMPKVKQYESRFSVSTLPYPVLWPREEDRARARSIMGEGRKYLILAPTANWEPKEWPVAQFIELSNTLLTGVCAGYRPVIICAGHERARALPLLEALASYTPLDLTTGKVPLLTLYACMEKAHGFIGNDSGLMHMAAAAGIPTLGIFGPTDDAIYQPWGKCTGYVKSPDTLMKSISPASIATSFEALLNASGRTTA